MCHSFYTSFPVCAVYRNSVISPPRMLSYFNTLTICTNCCGLLPPHAERKFLNLSSVLLILPHPIILYLQSSCEIIFFLYLCKPVKYKTHILNHKPNDTREYTQSNKERNVKAKRTSVKRTSAKIGYTLWENHAKHTLVNLRKWCRANRKQSHAVSPLNSPQYRQLYMKNSFVRPRRK